VNKLGVLTINSQPHANCVPRKRKISMPYVVQKENNTYMVQVLALKLINRVGA
jgi:hypothetical protein